MNPAEYQIPGGYRHDGMVLSPLVPKELLERVKEFHPDDSDTLVVSYPKTGTSWLQEVAWLIVKDGNTEEANKTPSMTRVPYVEFMDETQGNVASLDSIPAMAPPRVIKSHLPARYFSKQLKDDNCKFLVVVRNPKDTLVSMFHFYRMNKLLGNFEGSWDDFFGLFSANNLLYGSYFDWYEAWWVESTNSKVLFVHFEDMKRDLVGGIKRVAAFLGKVLPDDVIGNIANHCDFSAMKSNKATNVEHFPMEMLNSKISPFMRSGKVGDWKNYFTKEQSEAVDEIYESRLKSRGLLLAFE